MYKCWITIPKNVPLRYLYLAQLHDQKSDFANCPRCTYLSEVRPTVTTFSKQAFAEIGCRFFLISVDCVTVCGFYNKKY